MTWVKRTRERWLGEYYEGPEPPARLAQHVALFAREHPRATVSEWAEFASSHAMSSYRAGWERGYQWSAREDMGPKVAESERVAEELEHAWVMDGVPGTVDDPRVVPEERDERAEAAEVVDVHNRGSIEYDLGRRALGPGR
jgi:hypothetical protein